LGCNPRANRLSNSTRDRVSLAPPIRSAQKKLLGQANLMQTTWEVGVVCGCSARWSQHDASSQDRWVWSGPTQVDVGEVVLAGVRAAPYRCVRYRDRILRPKLRIRQGDTIGPTDWWANFTKMVKAQRRTAGRIRAPRKRPGAPHRHAVCN